MNLLLDIPVGLQATLLTRWLELVNISHLDLACANKKNRTPFVNSLSSDAVIFSAPLVYMAGLKYDSMLKWVVKRGMHIVDVDLSPTIEKGVLKNLCEHSGRILRIIYLHSFLIDKGNHALQLIAEYCPNLEQISLVNTAVSTALINALERCQKLRKIRFEKNSFLDTAILLGQAHPHITLVSLLESATDENIFPVVSAFPDALKVGVSNSPRFTGVGLSHIAAHCTRLQEACLYECSITDASVQHLAQSCRDLRVIDVGATKVGDTAVLALFQYCPHLTALYIEHNHEVSDPGLLALAHYSRALRILYITGCTHISARGVTLLLERAKSLHTLSIGEGTMFNTPELVTLTTKCGSLDTLRLRSVRLEEVVLSSLVKHAKSLEGLDLSGCDVSEEGLASVALQLIHLKLLVFADANNRAGLSFLSKALWKQLRPGLVISGDADALQYCLIL